MTQKKVTKKNNVKPTRLIIGAVSVGVIGVSGYALGASNNQDIQDFEPIYAISSQELKTAKSTLSSLLVRQSNINIPDYSSTSMPGWYDADNDGCPTRYDILVRDIINIKKDDANCKINSGTLFDYYTGSLIKYNRLVGGGGVDIDHIVAKENAWISGGYNWDNDQWKRYINDEDVLIATSAKANRSKGNKDASEWLPSNENFWCKYIVKQIQIKDKYHLSVSISEKAAIEDILSTNCKIK